MDLLKQSRQLVQQLEVARETALALRQSLGSPELMELNLLDKALGNARHRLAYHVKQAKLGKDKAPDKTKPVPAAPAAPEVASGSDAVSAPPAPETPAEETTTPGITGGSAGPDGHGHENT